MKQLLLAVFIITALSATGQTNRDSLLKIEKELAYADSVNTDFLTHVKAIRFSLDSILHPSADTAAFHYIKAADLGAFANDTLDDAAALQLGIDSCMKTKGLFILLEPGNYRNSKRLMIDWVHNPYRKSDPTKVPSRFYGILGYFIIEQKPNARVGLLYTGKEDE